MHECFERVFCELKWRKEVILNNRESDFSSLFKAYRPMAKYLGPSPPPLCPRDCELGWLSLAQRSASGCRLALKNARPLSSSDGASGSAPSRDSPDPPSGFRHRPPRWSRPRRAAGLSIRGSRMSPGRHGVRACGRVPAPAGSVQGRVQRS